MKGCRSYLASVIISSLGFACPPIWAQQEIILPEVTAGRDGARDLDHVAVFNFANLSDEGIDLELELFTDNGEPFKAFFCGSTIPFSFCNTSQTVVHVPRHGRSAAVTNALAIAKESGWASIRPTPLFESRDLSQVGVSLVLVTEPRSGGDTLAATSVIASAEIQLFSSIVAVSTDKPTLVALVNPSETREAIVDLKLIDTHEAEATAEMAVIPPRERLAVRLADDLPFGVLQGFEGLLQVSSSVPLVAAILETVDREDSLHFVQLPLFPRQVEFSPLLRAEPNPIQVCEGNLGRTTIFWRRPLPVAAAFEVRVGSPDGPVFARSRGDGSKETGNWVRDGALFFLVDPFDVYAQVEVRLTREGCP